MPRRFPTGTLLAMAALVVPACGGPDDYRFPIHPTDGRVTRRGAPVAGAFVRFHPADPASVQVPEGERGPPVLLTTETDAAGRFVMSTYLADDGIPAGDYTVTVEAGLPDVDVENSDGPRIPAPRPAAGPIAVYRDPATTPLKATVQTGENHFEFELN